METFSGPSSFFVGLHKILYIKKILLEPITRISCTIILTVKIF